MAVQAEASIVIDRSPEAVFAAITDVSHHTDWSQGVKQVTDLSHSPAVLGTTWKQTSRVMGQEVEATSEVFAFEENRKFGVEVNKPIPGKMIWQVEPSGKGAKVSINADFEPGGLFKVAAPMLAGSVKGSFERDLHALKARLESAA